jgi:hypothetical protein
MKLSTSDRDPYRRQRLKQLKYLIASGQVDDHFFWKC